ncbi:response regulator transcription factor [Fodinicola acaciae]|uniref:response regulator transcription factor n=1 Tax=Fodinicola acaciae TaxID=2681555 RepID=UPI0013D341C7|nr:response regulator transcription factor [Fodinicola acaciae]
MTDGVVLLVEDERPIADLQRLYLRREGFGVHVETDGRAGLAAARTLHPVAIVLDIRLPLLDGIEVCKALRAEGNATPILFVTARDDEADRILGLEIGADDYVTKPFSPRELVARIKAVLRRGQQPGPPVLVSGELTVDVAGRRVVVRDAEVELTATEFSLLAHLMRRPGQVFSRDQLLASVWGHAGPGSRTVDVHVAQLRAKLGADCPIRTFRGVGYGVDRR